MQKMCISIDRLITAEYRSGCYFTMITKMYDMINKSSRPHS